ncbi:MAG: hypothetical protein R2940_06870 [Syntrophotaleaceae bacterium]
MDVQKDRCYAALTGDVIKSSRLKADDRGRLHDTILKVGGELGKFFPDLLLGEISIFRGDSIQFLLTEPTKALRTALFFRAALKAAGAPSRIDMRFAIGVGGIDFLPENSTGGADGEAFRLSGQALDDLPLKQTLGLAVPENRIDPGCLQPLQTVVAMAGILAERWSVKQALAVKGALLDRTQEEIREFWPDGVSRQAVAKNLDAAGWFAVEGAVKCFENFRFEISATT